jgi:hypothetical protein
VKTVAARTLIKGWTLGHFQVGVMLKESSDGQWAREGKVVRFRPFFTRRDDGWMLSFVMWRYCMGIAFLR